MRSLKNGGTLRVQVERLGVRLLQRLRVTGVSLMAYAAGEIGGPLERMTDYDFGSDVLHSRAKVDTF